jgi:flavin reductase (DIM6/NTAB) family NADH-FMN oxidoreductase RutF
MSPGEIHDEHPFKTPPDQRDPVRQFRGRLAAPVTVVTAGTAEKPSGLTVSSLMVAEGEPSFVHFLAGDTTDLWHSIQKTEAFIVHILDEEHRELSDRFALIRPSPGGPFAGLRVETTEFGPELSGLGNRAYCRYVGHREDAHHVLVHGEIERIELHDLRHPLQYFRGEYFHG